MSNSGRRDDLVGRALEIQIAANLAVLACSCISQECHLGKFSNEIEQPSETCVIDLVNQSAAGLGAGERTALCCLRKKFFNAAGSIRIMCSALHNVVVDRP